MENWLSLPLNEHFIFFSGSIHPPISIPNVFSYLPSIRSCQHVSKPAHISILTVFTAELKSTANIQTWVQANTVGCPTERINYKRTPWNPYIPARGPILCPAHTLFKKDDIVSFSHKNIWDMAVDVDISHGIEFHPYSFLPIWEQDLVTNLDVSF